MNNCVAVKDNPGLLFVPTNHSCVRIPIQQSLLSMWNNVTGLDKASSSPLLFMPPTRSKCVSKVTITVTVILSNNPYYLLPLTWKNSQPVRFCLFFIFLSIEIDSINGCHGKQTRWRIVNTGHVVIFLRIPQELGNWFQSLHVAFAHRYGDNDFISANERKKQLKFKQGALVVYTWSCF